MAEVKGLDEDIELPTITVKYYIKDKPKYAIIRQNYDCELLTVFFENNSSGDTIALQRFGDVFEWILKNNYRANATKRMKRDWKGRLKYLVIGFAYLGNKKLMKNWEQIWKDKIKKKLAKIIEHMFSKYYESGNHLNRDGLSENDNITSTFLEEHIYTFEIEWTYYLGNKNLSEKILRDNLEKLDDVAWSYVSTCEYLSEDFYKYILNSQYASKLNIKSLCSNINLSDNFFERLPSQYKLDWYNLCGNNNLTLAFFKRHKGRIVWKGLCSNENIPAQFFLDNLDKLDKDAWIYLCGNKRMTDSFYDSIYNSMYQNKLDWNELCGNKNLTEKFYTKYMKYINWKRISDHPNISEKFYRKYIKHLSIIRLCGNKNLSPSFFDMLLRDPKYSKQIYWNSLCENTALTDTFFERLIEDPAYRDKLVWYMLCSNTNLSSAFFQRHMNKLDQRALENLYRNTNMTDEFFKKYIEDTNNPRLINKLIFNKGLSPVFLFSYSKYFEDGTIAWNSFDAFKEKQASKEVKKLYKQFGVEGVVHMKK